MAELESMAMGNYLESVSVLDSVYDRVNGYDFYSYIFPHCERSGDMHDDFSHPNAIFLYENDVPNAKKTYSRRIMLADTWEDDYMNLVEEKEYTLCSGMSFRGSRNIEKNEQCMNALIFDLDGVGAKQVQNLLYRFTFEPEKLRSLPMPTFLVVSGGGVHIYYVFDEPIDLFPNVRKQLKALKDDLTYKMWDWKSTSQFKKVQYQRIGQPFRMVGSINEKHGNEIIAYQIGDRVSIEYLNRYVMDASNKVDVQKRYASRMSREEAKELYPEWYQEKIVERKDRKKWDIKSKVHGKDPYALYHWWLRQTEHVTGGHRYFFMMFCVVYGCKCDVPREIIEKDLWEVYEKLKGVEHENPLSKEDVWSALKIYKKDMYNYTIDDIKKLTEVPIEKNKRNGRKREVHLHSEYWESEKGRPVINVCRQNRELALKYMRENGEIKGRPKGSKDKKPRKSKEQLVREYLVAHPEQNVTEMARSLGVSRPTIYKYLQNGGKK